VGFNVAGVHPFVQQVHGFPFAGAINTGKQDDDREPVRLQQIELGIQQPSRRAGSSSL